MSRASREYGAYEEIGGPEWLPSSYQGGTSSSRMKYLIATRKDLGVISAISLVPCVSPAQRGGRGGICPREARHESGSSGTRTDATDHVERTCSDVLTCTGSRDLENRSSRLVPQSLQLIPVQRFSMVQVHVKVSHT